MDRVKVLQDAAGYVERWARAQAAIQNKLGAKRARAVRTELLNMADELEQVGEEDKA